MTARSRAAVADVYEDVAEDIDDTARRFARAYNQRDRDDVRSEANVIFLHALEKYDPARGRLRPRIVDLVWKRLLDRVRSEAVKAKRLVLHNASDVAKDGGTVDAPAREPAFERAALYDRLSDDAEMVVRMLIETPDEIAEAYPLLGAFVPECQTVLGVLSLPGVPVQPHAVRSLLGSVLSALSWSPTRIREAFAEIGAALR